MSSVTFAGATKEFANGVRAVERLDLEVEDGELLVVVGPSGCGKTTTLRMLAGLEDISEGEVRIGDRVVNSVPARDRDIAMVFQSYALYPHLTVGGNLAYPLKLAGLARGERRERVEAVAKQLRLSELLERKPRELSGGQRQRVAMGRAMVRDPRVFLMDEPLSNLDAKLRVAMRAEVAELQRALGTTMFYVTHDQVEAMTMGHRVAVMNEGTLHQVAPPAELYRHPANVFVAGFIGSPPMNLLDAHLVDGSDGDLELRSGSLSVTLGRDAVDRRGDLRAMVGPDVAVGIRPEQIGLAAAGDGDGPVGIVRMVEMLGSESLVHIDVDGGRLLAVDGRDDQPESVGANRWVVKIYDDASVSVGDTVSLDLPVEELHVFAAPESTG